MDGLPRSIAVGVTVASSVLVLQGCLLIESFGGTYEVVPGGEAGSCGPAEGTCDAKWSQHFHGPNTSTVGGLAVSDADTVYVVGSFAGSLALDKTVQSIGVDAFAVALETTGMVRGSLVTAAGNAKATAVTTHGTDVIIAGTYTEGYAGCGDETGIFVLFTDSGLGTPDALCFPASGTPEVAGIAVDNSTGAVWIAGSYDKSLTVDPTTLMTEDKRNGFVFAIGLARPHAPIGAPIDVTGTDEQRIDAIAARQGGGFVVAGSFIDGISLAAETKTAIGGSDIFVALFDGSGVLTKLHAWGSEDDDESGGVVVAADGTVYLAGEVDGGELAFANGETVSPAVEDSVAGFVAAFQDQVDSLGEPQWVARMFAEDLDVTELTVSETFVFAGGLVTGTLTLESESTVPGSCDDMFVARIRRPDGKSPVATRCGNAAIQTLTGLGAAPLDDEVFFATEVSGSIRVSDSQSYTSEGDIDIVVGQVLPP